MFPNFPPTAYGRWRNWAQSLRHTAFSPVFSKDVTMPMTLQALPFNPAALPGLSEKLLTSHYQNNYGGAVKRLNAIRASLSQLDFAATPGFQLNGLKREELIATNSMLLHELHFASLGGDGKPPLPAMSLALTASFGSEARWRDEFVAMGKALGGGSGWVVLIFSPRDGALHNHWAADHTHALAGGVPILALDMYEHAYHMDFGANAGAWVDAFMGHINWAAVYARYQHAVHGVGEEHSLTQADLQGPSSAAILFDVRRAGVYQQSAQVLPGAQWRDPATVGQWAADVPKDQEVVVYCVYGHEVGRSTALRLRSLGIKARFLQGGIDEWQKASLPLDSK
jgi:Fe-Mn family superoxide dismutase